MELGKILKYQKGKAPGLTKGGNEFVVYLSPEYLRNKAQPTLIPDFWGKVEVQEKDLLLLWDGSNAGEFFVGKRGVLSSTMVKFTFDEEAYDKSFLYYQLKFVEGYLKARTNGSGIPHVDKEILFSINIEHFSTSEQRAIAAILSKIDAAIAETEQCIAKYSRIKTGLMHDLLTKGIDDDGNIRSEETHEFKDSPLGRIPREWEVVNITAYTKNTEDAVKPGPFGSSIKKEFYTEAGYKIYGQEQVIANNPFIGDYYIDAKRYKALYSFRVEANDILLSCVGTIGNVLIIPSNFEPGIINPRLIKFSLDIKKSNIYFFAEYLKHSSIGLQLINAATGGTMPVLNKKIVLNLKFVYPDLAEQNRIVERWKIVQKYLSDEVHSLTKLHSLKAGLMQDLLSGRVRVPVGAEGSGAE
jgi:type I restriction enzyme S subunit